MVLFLRWESTHSFEWMPVHRKVASGFLFKSIIEEILRVGVIIQEVVWRRDSVYAGTEVA